MKHFFWAPGKEALPGFQLPAGRTGGERHPQNQRGPDPDGVSLRDAVQ